jgi:hypothetical protein
MIETKILDYLQRKLNMTYVYLETPKTAHASYVVFQIVDRTRENYIDAVTVRLWSYGKTKEEAASLDELVRNAMYEITDVTDISSSTLGGGADDYDTSLNKYRYSCYFNITYMEE